MQSEMGIAIQGLETTSQVTGAPATIGSQVLPGTQRKWTSSHGIPLAIGTWQVASVVAVGAGLLHVRPVSQSGVARLHGAYSVPLALQ